MKSLVIPDVHHKINKLDKILDKYKECQDKVIFLGDFQDDFGDTPMDSKATAKWVKARLEKHPEDIFILSNHDQAYRFPYNRYLMCSGFEYAKAMVINEVMTPADWNRFKLFHFEQNFYLSHAGLHINVFGHAIDGITEAHLKEQCEDALDRAASNQGPKALMAGFARGGSQPYGGCTWLDFNDEFEPIENINQIVGHTPHRTPEFKLGVNSENYDIDTHLNHVGILQDGVFSYEAVEL